MATSGQGRIERRLAAILAADVAGYSRLTGMARTSNFRPICALLSIPRLPNTVAGSSKTPETGCWPNLAA